MKENEFRKKMLEITNTLLEEMRSLKVWAKFGGFANFKSIVNKVLTTDTDKRVYELSDGERSTRDIARRSYINLSHATVANMWQKWLEYGLVEPSRRYKGRFKKIISLRDLGFPIPEIAEEGDVAVGEEANG